ncbi:MAG: mechanosensitive ion channel family protein [Rhodoferax sp.]|nr:mechanosensitive ion channel family protein [Rhodoferax sp.]
MKKSYRALIVAIVVLMVMSNLTEGFIEPIAYVLQINSTAVWEYVAGAAAFVFTILVSRFIKQEFIHGYVERTLETKVPELIGTITSGVVIFIGCCTILSLVFGRNISTLLAAIAGSAALLGFALKDFAVALFAGIILNLEKSFQVGDVVRIGDKQGFVDQITWRNTILHTADRVITIPNVSIMKQAIQNLSTAANVTRRSVELTIDYDISVESVERILYAGVLGATGIKQEKSPNIFAKKMTPDGILYEVQYFISNKTNGVKADHAIIKNILESMRRSDITVALPRHGLVEGVARSKISNRSSDLFHLIQQVRLFRNFSDPLCLEIIDLLLPHRFPAGAQIVQMGELRNSLFIVAEGRVKRQGIDQDDHAKEEFFVSTEFFGARSLIACLPQTAKVVAETPTLIYELHQSALQILIRTNPGLSDALANNLAHIRFMQSPQASLEGVQAGDSMDHVIGSYRGQIEANYDVRPLI